MCQPARKSSCNCGHHAPGGGRRGDLAILNARFEVSAGQPAAAPQCNCGQRFCPRRVQSISGIVLGGGLVFHLFVNSLGLWPASFQQAVDAIHRLGPVLPVLEVLLIFVPLLVHIGYGIRFLVRAGWNYHVEPYHHGSDQRYLMQRITAVIVLVFMLFHVGTLHRWGLHLASQASGWPVLERYHSAGLFEPQARAFESTVAAVRSFWPGLPVDSPLNLAVVGFYLLGLVAGVYHLANGSATAAEVLGFAETAPAQSRAWLVAVAGAALLLLVGAVGWYAFGLGVHS